MQKPVLLQKFFQKETVHNFLKIFSGAVLVQILSLVLSPLLARLFTPDDFGLAALYLSIFSLVSVIATAKYEQAILLPKSDADAHSLFWLVLILASGISFAMLIIVAIFGYHLATFTGNLHLEIWLWILPIAIVLHGVSQGCMYYSNRTKQFGTIATNNIVQGLSLNAIRVFSGLIRSTPNGLLLGQIFSQILATIHFVWHNWKLLRSFKYTSLPLVCAMAKKYSAYPKFNLLLNLTNNLSGALPVLLFTRGFSAEAAGLFAFGLTFVFKPLNIFSHSLSQVLSQQIIAKYNQGYPISASLLKLVSRQFWIGIIPFLLLTLIVPTLFEWFFPPVFHYAGIFVQILMPWFFMVYLASPLAFIPEMLQEQKKAMKIDLVYLILRFFALSAGIWLESILLSLVFFSAVSSMVVGYNLFWYFRLVNEHKKRTESMKNSQPTDGPFA